MTAASKKALTTSYTEKQNGLAWLGLAWLGLAWLGLAKCACARSLSFIYNKEIINIRHRELAIIL